MFNPITLIIMVLVYAGFLFLIALWVERKTANMAVFPVYGPISLDNKLVRGILFCGLFFDKIFNKPFLNKA